MTTLPNVYDISFDANLNAVVMIWKGYSTTEQFREGTELMLNHLIYNSASRVLADLREMIIIGLEEQNWLVSKFLPRAIDFGFKQIAIINPTSYFNKVALESISYKVDKDKMDIQFFNSKEEAIIWLSSF